MPGILTPTPMQIHAPVLFCTTVPEYTKYWTTVPPWVQPQNALSPQRPRGLVMEPHVLPAVSAPGVLPVGVLVS